jgi:hypothetical protein
VQVFSFTLSMKNLLCNETEERGGRRNESTGGGREKKLRDA